MVPMLMKRIEYLRLKGKCTEQAIKNVKYIHLGITTKDYFNDLMKEEKQTENIGTAYF